MGYPNKFVTLLSKGIQTSPNIADLFSITLDTAANLDGVSTTDWDLLVGKSRANVTDWVWRDSAQGIGDYIESNTTNAAVAFSDYATLLGSGNGVLYRYKNHPKFFDVVTFTHTNGVTSNVATALTVPLGLATIKRLDSTSDWYTNHRSLTSGYNLRLNNPQSESNTNAYVSFSDSTVVFAAGAPSGDYVVYVWGHDTGVPGVVQAGGYTGNGSATGPEITLGWQPQLLLLKRLTGGLGNWLLMDTARGEDRILGLDDPSGEFGSNYANFLSSGFQIASTSAAVNNSGNAYAYLAIRTPS